MRHQIQWKVLSGTAVARNGAAAAQVEMLRRERALITHPMPDEPAAHGGTVADALAGDRSAFDRLVEQRLERAYRTARAIIGNESDARDATQDAFLQAWRNRRQLRDPARFDRWLGRILLNSCRQIQRGRRRRAVREIAASDLLDPVESIPVQGIGSDEQAAWMDAVERAFEQLSTDERAILVLHHLDRQSLPDVAASFGIPVGTAKSRLHAARHSLERALEAELR